MSNLELQIILNGKLNNVSREKNSKLNIDPEIQQQIDVYVEGLYDCQDELRHIGKGKVKHDIAEGILKINEKISSAINLILNNGHEYLLENEFYKLSQNLMDYYIFMQSESFLKKEREKEIKITEESFNALLLLSTFLFDKKEYEDCFNLLVMLIYLNPNCAEYWLKLGVTAQMLRNYELALRSYKVAYEKNSNLIAAKFFAVDCYIRINLIPEAKMELQSIKSSPYGANEEWKEVILNFDLILK